MAFINEPAANNPATAAVGEKVQGQGGSFEKAAAFINVDVVLGDGSKRRVGGVPLKVSEALHKAILELSEEQFDKLKLEFSLSKVNTESKTYTFNLD